MHRVQYHLRFQVSTGGLATDSPADKGGGCYTGVKGNSKYDLIMQQTGGKFTLKCADSLS